MDDFGMLAKDFGFRPSGKSAPMKSTVIDRRNKPASNDILFNDVVSTNTPPKFTNNNSKSTPSISDYDYDYDSLFKDSNNNNYNNEAKSKIKSNSNMNSPVYDKPLYDDDVFEGLGGMKSKPVSSSSGSVRYDENIFASMTSEQSKKSEQSDRGKWSEQSLQSDQFDDLLGSLGRTEKAESIGYSNSDVSSRGLDDLIPGFGSGSAASINRRNSDPSTTSTGKTNKKSVAVDDPFVVLESLSTPVSSTKDVFTDPLDEISKFGKSKRTKSGVSSPSGDVLGDIDSLSGFDKSPPAYVKETNNRKKGRIPSEEGSSVGSAHSSVSREPPDESSFGYSESQPQKMPFDDFQESHQIHDLPNVSRNTRRSFDQTTSPSSHTESMSPKSEEHVHYADEIWLTVSEIPLFTPVTKSPPPSRPAPPVPTRAKKSERASFASSAKTFDNDFSSSSNSAKYSQNTNASRNKEPVQVDRDEQTFDEEREEEEKEQRKVEKERMREIEREKARQAVERANREARERAASEARLKAERAAVQRAQTEARERAAVEARERAERVAAERASKEKAEKEAHEKAQKEAQEKVAVAKAQAEARRRAERAAVERVTAEARERAAAEARERAATAAAEARERAATAAAAATKMNQQKNDDDLDSFFGTGSRPSSVRKARTTSNDSATDPSSQDKRRPEGAQNVRKASSTTNFVDDLSSIFGAATPSGEFQDVEGETEERRRARLERQQRTQERAAKALAEKNQRDQQVLKEQEEKHRISTTLDVEIKRWASGKEGNLRAMLSTLQFVLWPECGWQPISLTDLITGANVKKAYRKATLCIHPDKVQQKGANLQQKYVAEKVFDLLKEAWNKFNSEELF